MSQPGGTTGAPSVLIAEDDADIRVLVSAVLTTAGYLAEVADGGIAALAAARRARPTIVVLDVRMPDLSGLDVCRRVKACAPTARCAVLLMSSDSSTEDVAAGYAAGADDYLAKPFSPRELVTRVRALLTRLDPELDEDDLDRDQEQPA